MKPRFLSFGWMLAAFISMPTWGQTIVPNPRPGAVFWTKTETTMTDGVSLWMGLHTDPSSFPFGLFTLRLYGRHSQSEVSDCLNRRAFPELASDKSRSP
jgi:hypothetical protein